MAKVKYEIPRGIDRLNWATWLFTVETLKASDSSQQYGYDRLN